MHKIPLWRSKFLALLDWFLHHTFVPLIQYLGFTLEGRRVSWLRRGTCPLASPIEVWYEYTPSKSPFSGAVAREQVIKIQSSIAFCIIFSFLLVFFLNLLTFDHPQNQSNLVCLTLVFLYLFLFFVLCIFCLLLTLTGDGWLPLQQTR
jgi:hypothetical protein